jgi:cholesterol transport system auxiliary component
MAQPKEQTMRSMISIFLLMVGCVAESACVSTRPVHYYALQASPPPANRSKADGLILLVGNIATPEILQDSRIRYRAGNNDAGTYEYHRWTERPGPMVRNALMGALRDSGKYRRVLEAGSSIEGDYLLRGKLDEFDEVDQASIRTKISLRVELVDRKTNQNVWDYMVEREEPVSAKSVADVVQSLDRNLQHVVGDIAGELDKFLATRRSTATAGN